MSCKNYQNYIRMKLVEVTVQFGEDRCFQYYNTGTQSGDDCETGIIEISLNAGLPNETSITIGVWESIEPKPFQRVMIIHGDWMLEGKLESVEQVSPQETHYHCSNSLFPFMIAIKNLIS